MKTFHSTLAATPRQDFNRRTWLKVRGVKTSSRITLLGRQRLLAAIEKIRYREALLAALRAEARRRGTTFTGAALGQAAHAMADLVKTFRDSHPTPAAARRLPLRVYIPGVGLGIFYRDL